ncbi:MAG: hypothetical protein ABSD92_02480 [Candidatus Bathyarchaeia archaeon]|jgi:hypothetical protein
MNSTTLIETGFTEWFPLKTLTFSNLPPNKDCVIIIVDKELSGKPESDILYIGRTKRSVKRILGGYLAGYGGKKTKKINQMLFDEGYIENAAISWILTDKPRIMQKELLAKFKEANGKFPVWNAKKKLNVKPKKTPVPKPKAAAPRVKVRPITKSVPRARPKIVSTKRPAAKTKTSTKTETASKGETAVETPEKAKLSDTEMAT